MAATAPISRRRAKGLRALMRETVGLALLATIGCELADFEVERQGTATIPRDDPGGPFEMMRLDDFEVELGEFEDEHGIGREDIAEARLVRLTLTVIEPTDVDLSFIDRIEVFAVAPGLEKARVAHIDEMPRDASVVELDTDDVDLRDYLAAPTVTFVARIDGESPPVDVRVSATAVLDVGVTVRGACDHGL